VLNTIILLTGPVEQPVLASVLQSHNPQLTVRLIETAGAIAALEPLELRHARLVAFSTDVVVTPKVLDQLGHGAYNFHPGPPNFPGWRPAHFAVHRQATEFGATAHFMVEQVDAGPIVGVELFPIPPGSTVQGLEELTYARLARLFHRLARVLATQADPLPELPIFWSGKRTTRRALAALNGLPLDMAAAG
jgi:methionyl-tRNA formyltransferase